MAETPDTSMLDTLGFERRVLMEEGRAVLEFMAGLHMCHSGGVVQGGFVTAWIDSAMAHAVFAQGIEGVVPMSLEVKVSFFAPVRPGPVIAEGWVERGGKSTCFCEGELRNAAGDILAKASSTLRLVSMTKVVEGSRAALAAG
jgi:acyl-CoA thioesterase